MTRSIMTTLAAAVLVACNPGGTFEGKLVDAMSNQPRADVRVLAKAEKTADLTCQVRESVTDANGVFKIDNTCPDAVYSLKLGDDALLVQDSPEITGGQPSTGIVELTVWRAPAGSGVFKLKDDKLTAIRTFSDVGTETILGSTEKVVYPTKKPLQAPVVESDAWLVLAGKETIDKLKFFPLEEDQGVRKFEGDVSIEDHVYVGVKFTSDTEFNRTHVTLDTSKMKNVTAGDRMVRYMAADALPPGRYAIMPEDGRRMYVLDFGGASEPAAKADTE